MLKIDLKCPIEILNYYLIRPEGEESTVVTLTLHNLSGSIVSDMTFTVEIFGLQEEYLGSVAGELHGLALLPGDEYSCRLSVDGSNQIDTVDIVFHTVSFVDAQDWTQDPQGERIPLAIPQTIEAQRKDLWRITGMEGVCFAADLQQHWRCICGRLNDREAEKCVRCGEDRDYALQHYTVEAVSRLVMQENQREISKRIRQRRVLPILLPVLLAVVVVSFFVIKNDVIPNSRYTSGIRYLEAGNYAKAESLFAGLPEFQDADLLKEYARASLLLENKQYDQASEAFAKVAGKTDYPDLTQEALLLKAKALFDLKDYSAAAKEFERILDYKDSTIRWQECHYLQAKAYLETGTPFAAISHLQQIPDYQDATYLLQHLPLQFCGRWRLTALDRKSPYDDIVIVVGEDGSLQVPDEFFGSLNESDPLHVFWNKMGFDAIGESGKTWGFISVTTTEDPDVINITAGNKRGGYYYRYSCERL